MFIIRFVIFTIGANKFIVSNLQSSMIVGLLVCVIILFLDIFYSKFITNINSPDRYKRKVYGALVVRLLLALIIGFLSGTSIHSILVSGNPSNILLNGKATYSLEFSILYNLIVLLFICFELLFVTVKYWMIKKSIDDLVDYKIYLAIFNNRYLPAHEKDLFIKIIRSLKTQEQEFNSMRMILESMLKNLNKKGVIPNELFHSHGGPNLTFCGLYLKGKEINITRKEKTSIVKANNSFPENIGVSFHFVLEISNKLSHHNNFPVSNNLYKSVIYNLFDCLLWYKGEIDKK